LDAGASALARRPEVQASRAADRQEAIDTIEDEVQRLRRIEKQLALIVPKWSIAPVVEAYPQCAALRFSSP
jgi:hypothetical protein